MKLANENLTKADCCAEAYRRLASSGSCLMFPVSIMSKTHRPDIKTPYHLSVKVFDVEKDNTKEAHDIASRLDLKIPDSKKINLEFSKIPGREGHTYHAINLTGLEIDKLSEHFNSFSNMGFDQHKEFHPHIIVDEKTWNELKNKIKNFRES